MARRGLIWLAARWFPFAITPFHVTVIWIFGFWGTLLARHCLRALIINISLILLNYYCLPLRECCTNVLIGALLVIIIIIIIIIIISSGFGQAREPCSARAAVQRQSQTVAKESTVPHPHPDKCKQIARKCI